MSFITSKRICFVLLIGLATALLVNSFVSHITSQPPGLPPLLEARDHTEVQQTDCDRVVFVMDDSGNVYSGKTDIGSLSDRRGLTRRVREIIGARISALAYAGGMDINLELPLPRCVAEPIYAKANRYANDSQMKALVKVLQAAGAKPICLIVRRSPQKKSLGFSPWEKVAVVDALQ